MTVDVAQAEADGLPVIDEGMRLSYESCSCCLSDAFPDIKAALDAERAAKVADQVASEVASTALSLSRDALHPASSRSAASDGEPGSAE